MLVIEYDGNTFKLRESPKICQTKTNELQTPKLVSKGTNGTSEKLVVKEKRLESKDNPQPSS